MKELPLSTHGRRVGRGMPSSRGECFTLRVILALAVSLLALIAGSVVMSSVHPVTLSLGDQHLLLIGHAHEGELEGISLDPGDCQFGVDVSISGYHWSATYYWVPEVPQGSPVILGEPADECVVLP